MNWCTLAGAALLAFALGFWFASRLADADRLDFERELNKQNLAVVQEQQEISEELTEKVYELQEKNASDKEQLQAKYDRIVDDLHTTVDRLRRQQRTEGGEGKPGHTEAAQGVRQGQCRPSGQNRRINEKALEEILEVAKDCDELALKYNSLLDFYEDVREAYTD